MTTENENGMRLCLSIIKKQFLNEKIEELKKFTNKILILKWDISREKEDVSNRQYWNDMFFMIYQLENNSFKEVKINKTVIHKKGAPYFSYYTINALNQYIKSIIGKQDHTYKVDWASLKNTLLIQSWHNNSQEQKKQLSFVPVLIHKIYKTR